MTKDLLKYLKIFKKYLGKKIYLIFILTALSSTFESVGILMVLPLFQNFGIENPRQNANDQQIVFEFLNYLNIPNEIGIISFLIIICFLIKGGIMFLALALTAYLRALLQRNLKNKLFGKYAGMTYQFYLKRNTGHFINLINEQSAKSVASFNSLAMFLSSCISVIVYLAFALLVNWALALLAVFLGSVVLVVFKTLNSLIRQLSLQNALLSSSISSFVIQTLQGFKYLKSTSQIGEISKDFYRSTDQQRKLLAKIGYSSSFAQSIREPIAVIFVIIIIYWQIKFNSQDPSSTIVTIILFYRSLVSLLTLQVNWQKMLEMIGSMELIDQEYDKIEQEKNFGKLQNIDKPVNIEFKSVTLEYDRRKTILDNLSLKIESNSSVAFVGTSGAGKTSLIDMIPLLLLPNKGEIFFNNNKFNNIDIENWRKGIGYVSQDSVIFDGSILFNICFKKNLSSLSESELERVTESLKTAQLKEFVKQLEHGLDTKVGDRGIKLSGGQKQRLFIAREIYREPHLLIMDEATSSLDSKTERDIKYSLDKIKGQLTLIIIAHRLSTIENVDRIFVLSLGSIVEEGSYKSLLKNKESYFYSMAKKQGLV